VAVAQVDEKASSLNSNDCFVLVTPKTTWAWCGKGATGDERAVAKTVAEALAPPASVETVAEGKEPEAFWAALGGKGAYVTPPPDQHTPIDPRLFQCSNASGQARTPTYVKAVTFTHTNMHAYIHVGARHT
jgi:hypothetical protein